MTLTRAAEPERGTERPAAAPRPTGRSWVARAWSAFGAAPSGRRVRGSVWVFLLGCLIGTAASIYTVHAGTNLDYGDAMAHQTIARRILDSKAPGLQQLGTVWLPLPHLLLMPLVQNLFLFRTGIAACILGTALPRHRRARALPDHGPARLRRPARVWSASPSCSPTRACSTPAPPRSPSRC